MCVLLITWLMRGVGRWARKLVHHTSWLAVVTPTDRPKSVRNRCLIELFCGVGCVVALPFWHLCWCRDFCHRTGSDLLLFVVILQHWTSTNKFLDFGYGAVMRVKPALFDILNVQFSQWLANVTEFRQKLAQAGHETYKSPDSGHVIRYRYFSSAVILSGSATLPCWSRGDIRNVHLCDEASTCLW